MSAAITGILAIPGMVISFVKDVAGSRWCVVDGGQIQNYTTVLVLQVWKAKFLYPEDLAGHEFFIGDSSLFNGTSVKAFNDLYPGNQLELLELISERTEERIWCAPCRGGVIFFRRGDDQKWQCAHGHCLPDGFEPPVFRKS